MGLDIADRQQHKNAKMVASGDELLLGNAMFASMISLMLLVTVMWKLLAMCPGVVAAFSNGLKRLSRFTLEFCYTMGQPPRRIEPNSAGQPSFLLMHLAANLSVLLWVLSLVHFGWAFQSSPAHDTLDIDRTMTDNEVGGVQKWCFLTMAFLFGGGLSRAHESKHPLPTALLLSK